MYGPTIDNSAFLKIKAYLHLCINAKIQCTCRYMYYRTDYFSFKVFQGCLPKDVQIIVNCKTFTLPACPGSL